MSALASTLSLESIQQLETAHQPPLYAKRDIALVRGEGSYLFDSEGRRYLDAMSNYGVAVLGHADPEYAAALAGQLATLTTCHQSFYNDARAEALAAVVGIAPAGLTRAFFSNSGAEAIEAGLKFAMAATGRHKIVAAKRGYHGRTLGALSATADPKYRAPFEPLPIEATHTGFNDLEALRAAVDETTAAIILEPLQGEGGIYPADASYLQGARAIADATGALLIADEIQSGFRTGAPFLFTAAGVAPDIAVTAKALGNGFPIGLTLTSDAISEKLPPGTHGTTFGANPLACRAAVVTLHALSSRGLYANAERIGQRLMSGIRALGSPKVRDVRGRGLMIGVELKERVTPTLKGLQDRGVLALPATPVVFRLLPPMIWGDEQVDEFLAALRETLQ
jgi:LysW-gamma-L-lysine/LysW-L-ornithine aminotransferase